MKFINGDLLAIFAMAYRELSRGGNPRQNNYPILNFRVILELKKKAEKTRKIIQKKILKLEKNQKKIWKIFKKISEPRKLNSALS